MDAYLNLRNESVLESEPEEWICLLSLILPSCQVLPEVELAPAKGALGSWGLPCEPHQRMQLAAVSIASLEGCEV